MPANTELLKEIELIEDGLTHMGNALRLQKGYQKWLKYNPINGQWYIFKDVVWKPDGMSAFFQHLRANNMLLHSLAEELEDKKLRDKIIAWCKSSENYSNISSTEKISQLLPGFKQVDKWDNKEYLFAVENGVIDLKTGELKSGKPEDLITLQSPIIYDKEAECPLWEKFMFEAFDEDLDVIHYIQKALGYSLTGSNKEQIIFIGYGTGSNGKSTMLRILLKILGDYGHTAARQTFQLNRFNDQTNDIAQLPGKRFVSWSETRMSSSLDEEKLKAMTGGENQRARFLNHEFFEFAPILKLWMFFNHKPTARDDSQGFWRRIRVIPFNHVFDGSDKDIDVKLSKELPGILNWLIEGCLMWQQEGLEPLPEVIQEASATYQEESDPLSQWIFSCITIDDQKSERAADLYKSYYNWANGEGFSDKEILTQNMFGRRLTTKFKKVRDTGGLFYIGLSIISAL